MSDPEFAPHIPTAFEPTSGPGWRSTPDDSALRQLLGGHGLQVRVARQTGQLAAVVAFYRDGLGLPEIARFTGHYGYDGVMLDLPGTAAHLEFTATASENPPNPHPEHLLVLYLGDRRTVDTLLARSGAKPVPSTNPYWDRVGVTVTDPDGFRVVLVAGTWSH